MNGDDDDDDFLSLVAAVEADIIANKRRKINGGGGGTLTESTISTTTTTTTTKEEEEEEEEGAYTAALKGRSNKGTLKPIANNFSALAGTVNSDDACFKCGKLGHWSRDCGGGIGGGGGNGGNESVVEKGCPCGLGVCSVFTANTERNRGRKFYRCPAREENGGCGFFEWCDNSSGAPVSSGSQYSSSNSSFPELQCSCGAGSCLVLTAKTGQNIGQQFYRCPAKQSCGFFKWCVDRKLADGRPTSNSGYAQSQTYGASGGGGGSSCFKCGQEGHWSNKCPNPSVTSSAGMGGMKRSGYTNTQSYGGSGSSGCLKCGQEGHWARDCPNSSSLSSPASTRGATGGKSASSGTCYSCDKSGHWSRDCPSKGSGNVSASYSSYR